MSFNMRDYVSDGHIESIGEIAKSQSAIIQALSLENSKLRNQLQQKENIIKEFRSINEAGRETNSSIGTIQKCCVGISHTCNGYKWKYVLDKDGGNNA